MYIHMCVYVYICVYIYIYIYICINCVIPLHCYICNAASELPVLLASASSGSKMLSVSLASARRSYVIVG